MSDEAHLVDGRPACTGTTHKGLKCRSTSNLQNGVCFSHDALRQAEEKLKSVRERLEHDGMRLRDTELQLKALMDQVEEAKLSASEPPDTTAAELMKRSIAAAEAGKMDEANVWCAMSKELRQVAREYEEQKKAPRRRFPNPFGGYDNE